MRTLLAFLYLGFAVVSLNTSEVAAKEGTGPSFSSSAIQQLNTDALAIEEIISSSITTNSANDTHKSKVAVVLADSGEANKKHAAISQRFMRNFENNLKNKNFNYLQEYISKIGDEGLGILYQLDDFIKKAKNRDRNENIKIFNERTMEFQEKYEIFKYKIENFTESSNTKNIISSFYKFGDTCWSCHNYFFDPGRCVSLGGSWVTRAKNDFNVRQFCLRCHERVPPKQWK